MPRTEHDYLPPGKNGRWWWLWLAFPGVVLAGQIGDLSGVTTPSHRYGYSIGLVVAGIAARLTAWVAPAFVSGGKRTRWKCGYAPPRWARDPAQVHQWRYWDGWHWTSKAADGGVEVEDAIDGVRDSLRPVGAQRPLRRGRWWAPLGISLVLIVASVISELARHSTHPITLSHGSSDVLAICFDIVAAFAYGVPGFISGGRREEDRQAAVVLERSEVLSR